MSTGSLPRRFILKIICNNCGISESGKTRLVWLPDASFIMECGNCGEIEKMNLIPVDRKESENKKVNEDENVLIKPEIFKKKKNGPVN